MAQTSMEWFVEQLPIRIVNMYYKEIEQAKQIEKEQIMDARNNGIVNTLKGYSISNEEYYNETYNKQ